MQANPPVDVQQYGQSIWYDNISRAFLQNGEIQRLVDEDGVLGITSNPTIFEKAIAYSTVYDQAIAQHLEADTNTLYEALVLEDIRAAADILYPVFQRTDGVDGYISLEVSPLIADDTATTISEAERLFHLVDRPNVMIKIPATPAGIPAIEEALFRGINVNVTLIFAVEAYTHVAEAYLRGLERRLAEGQDIRQIASVASFFLSRIDTMVDQQLESNIFAAQGRSLDRVSANRRLLGTAAIANAKIAYCHFQTIFESGERFARLQAAGARVQRPLWASTGTKNPAYSDTLYVDTLIGPHTVNTVPPETLRAFKHHGRVAPTLLEELDKAEEVLDMLAEVGINLDMVTTTLLADGVEKFATSFQQLMAAIEGKRFMLRAGLLKRQFGTLGAYGPGVRDTIKVLQDAPERIWGRQADWWKEDRAHQEVVRNRLGWLDVFDERRIDRQRLHILQGLAQAGEYSHVVLLGMGGSSLAPEVLAKTFGKQPNFPELLVLDSTVPAAITHIESQIDLAKTLFVVASKSGSTIETACFFDYFYQRTLETLDVDQVGAQFIVITDPNSPLSALSHQRQVLEIFENPPDIGGRYSALSYFGLVPAALLGLDLDRLFASAERMAMAIDRVVPAEGNPAIILAALMGHIGKDGRDKITLLSSPQISSLGDWVEQLVAESTGKEGVGLVPVVGATFGLPHDYDDDRLMIYLRLDGEQTELDANVQTLREAGHPVYTIELEDAYDLGGEFLRWEFATAVVGKFLGINPFDEPDVALAKRLAKDGLQAYQEEGALPIQHPLFTEANVSLYANARLGEILQNICDQCNYDSTQLEGLLAAHIGLARSGNYIGLLAYLESRPANDSALQNIRRRLRHTTKRAVTIGYGPRYLHSTGQLHKGGPNTGVFIMITVDDDVELPIAGKPYSFNVLKQAQALGDMRALQERGRRVVRLHIAGDIRVGLEKIDKAIEAIGAKNI